VPEDSQHQNGVIVEALRRDIRGLVAVYRFGSTADGTATDGSDTDIGFLAREAVSSADRFDVQEALAARLGCDVDLVDLSTATPVMAVQVVAHGQLLFDGDGRARGDFEDRTFGAYARLNEERRAILERIGTEGTVYGR